VVRTLVLGAALASVAGCGSSSALAYRPATGESSTTLEATGRHDLECPVGPVVVRASSQSRFDSFYLVEGCGQRATYAWQCWSAGASPTGASASPECFILIARVTLTP